MNVVMISIDFLGDRLTGRPKAPGLRSMWVIQPEELLQKECYCTSCEIIHTGINSFVRFAGVGPKQSNERVNVGLF